MALSIKMESFRLLMLVLGRGFDFLRWYSFTKSVGGVTPISYRNEKELMLFWHWVSSRGLFIRESL